MSLPACSSSLRYSITCQMSITTSPEYHCDCSIKNRTLFPGAQTKTRKVRWLLQRFQVGMESFEIARKFSIVYNTRVDGASAENPRINSEANESLGDLTKVTLVFNATTQLFLTHKRLSRNDGKCQVQEKETQQSFPQSLSLPPVIWVLGGPGSCKATRVAKAVQGRPWKVVNFG